MSITVSIRYTGVSMWRVGGAISYFTNPVPLCAVYLFNAKHSVLNDVQMAVITSAKVLIKGSLRSRQAGDVQKSGANVEFFYTVM